MSSEKEIVIGNATIALIEACKDSLHLQWVDVRNIQACWRTGNVPRITVDPQRMIVKNDRTIVTLRDELRVAIFVIDDNQNMGDKITSRIREKCPELFNLSPN